MTQKKPRDSTPQQRVAKAKACRNGDREPIDFDYDETEQVLRATLAELTQDAEGQHRRVKGIADTLRTITLPPPAKATG